MNTTCDYCHKTFSSLSNLKTHLKSSRKCILSRNSTETNVNNIQIENHVCQHCHKSFSQKIHLLTHLNTCKLKEINALKEELTKCKNDLFLKDEMIKNLQQKLDKKNEIIEDICLKQAENFSSKNNYSKIHFKTY